MPNNLAVSAPPSFSTQEELEQLLLEGLNSGEPIEATAAFWENLRQEAQTAFERQQARLPKAS